MVRKIIKLVEIPNDLKVFAKFESDGEIFYSRCRFIGFCDNYDPCFINVNCDEIVTDPTTTSNFIEYEIIGADIWLSEEEFYKKYMSDEYAKSQEVNHAD